MFRLYKSYNVLIVCVELFRFNITIHSYVDYPGYKHSIKEGYLIMAETWNPRDAYAPDGHDHDERYSKVGHSHDGIGDLPAHNHDASYSLKDHNHDDRYSLKDHNHDGDYAPYDHDHGDKYAPYHDHEDFVTVAKFEEHEDSDLHLRDGERDKWNAKSNAHDHPYAPLSHVDDSIHVTPDDKEKWNGKEDKGHDHDEKYVILNVFNDHVNDYTADKAAYAKHILEDNAHAHDDKYIKTADVAAYVIESKNNIEKYTDDNKTLISRSWYRKWSDGTLEQGGWYWGNEVGGEADTIVNLTIPFIDNIYQVFYTACVNGIVGGPERYHHTVYGKTINSFYVQDNMLFNYLGLDWYARGTYKTTATS